MAFETSILESKVSYTIEDNADGIVEDWVKVRRSVIMISEAI